MSIRSLQMLGFTCYYTSNQGKTTLLTANTHISKIEKAWELAAQQLQNVTPSIHSSGVLKIRVTPPEENGILSPGRKRARDDNLLQVPEITQSSRKKRRTSNHLSSESTPSNTSRSLPQSQTSLTPSEISEIHTKLYSQLIQNIAEQYTQPSRKKRVRDNHLQEITQPSPKRRKTSESCLSSSIAQCAKQRISNQQYEEFVKEFSSELYSKLKETHKLEIKYFKPRPMIAERDVDQLNESHELEWKFIAIKIHSNSLYLSEKLQKLNMRKTKLESKKIFPPRGMTARYGYIYSYVNNSIYKNFLNRD